MEFSFTAELWEYPGKATWFFLSLPAEIADEIAEMAPQVGGFGSVRVRAKIGDSQWQTSLFPDRKRATYLLPVKKQVRIAHGLRVGSLVQVHLSLISSR